MTEKSIVGAIATFLFALFGIILLIWPDRVRDYDAKMTLIVKDPSTYKLMARVIGAGFVLAAGLIIVILTTSE